jgi:hypothetical protein
MSATTSTPIDFTKPMVDNVKVPGVGRMAGKTLSFFVSAELMKNQQAASPVDATGSTIVLQDSNGKPMILSIGTDQKLWLLRYDESSPSGWEAIDLGAGFPGYGAAAAFDAAQDGQGRISLAVALAREGATGTDVFTAALLSDDSSKTNWSKLASIASKVDQIDPTFVADTIEVGVTDDGEPPIVVVSGAIGSQEYYYRINAAGQPARKLEFPENVAGNLKALQGISLGYVRGFKGVFFLYRQGESQTLECSVTAPDIGTATVDFSPGNGAIAPDVRYNCMAAPPAGATASRISSDIFVGTDKGIYVIRNADTNTFEKVTDQLTDVHEIIVRQDDERSRSGPCPARAQCTTSAARGGRPGRGPRPSCSEPMPCTLPPSVTGPCGGMNCSSSTRRPVSCTTGRIPCRRSGSSGRSRRRAATS